MSSINRVDPVSGNPLVLFPHQKEAVSKLMLHLLRKKGDAAWAALLHDPGLGKTVTILTLWAKLNTLKVAKTGKPVRMIISCPAATLRSVWESHIYTWLKIAKERVLVVDSLAALCKHKDVKGFDIIIITRNLVASAFTKTWAWDKHGVSYLDRLGRERYKGGWVKTRPKNILFDNSYDLVVIDESHFMRNLKPKAVIIDSHNKLSNQCRFGILCTATPVCNRPADIAGQCSALAVESRGDPSLCDPKMWHGPCGWRTLSVQNTRLFNRNSFRLTEDILNLKPITRSVEKYAVVLSPPDVVRYNDLLFEAKELKAAMDANGRAMSDMCRLLGIIQRLRQMTVHHKLFELGATLFTEAVMEECILAPSAFMKATLRTMKRLIKKGHKQIVIFGIHSNSVMPLIIEYLKRYLDASTWFGLYSGSLTQKQRTTMCSDFLTPSATVKILSIQIQAGGVGLNLVPGPDAAVFLQQAWSPSDHKQAEKRIHRIGQTKPVKVVHIIGKGTVDEAINTLHYDKLMAASAIIDDKALNSKSEWRVKGRAIDLCKNM